MGIVGEVAVDEEGTVGPAVYHPHAQYADRSWALTYVVAAAGDAAGLVPKIREAVRELDPLLLVHEPALLEEVVAEGYGRRRLARWSASDQR